MAATRSVNYTLYSSGRVVIIVDFYCDNGQVQLTVHHLIGRDTRVQGDRKWVLHDITTRQSIHYEPHNYDYYLILIHCQLNCGSK